jgi:hypothetical protein
VLELTDVLAALVERHGGTRGVLGLRTALQQLCKATLDDMHGKALSKLTSGLMKRVEMRSGRGHHGFGVDWGAAWGWGAGWKQA